MSIKPGDAGEIDAGKLRRLLASPQRCVGGNEQRFRCACSFIHAISAFVERVREHVRWHGGLGGYAGA
jgi:hypothetical protein